MQDPDTYRPGDDQTSRPGDSPVYPGTSSAALPGCLSTNSPSNCRGAIVLCGGRSARMGRDKASLPFGRGETLLGRVVGLIGQAVPLQHLICVASAGQPLPPLPADVRTVYDQLPEQGPLAALATGLAALDARVGAAFVAGCDIPLLSPALIERMFDLLQQASTTIVAAHDGRHWQPLAGVYRRDVLPQVESLLAKGERSLARLLESAAVRRVSLDELRGVDPDLRSLTSCNSPDEYAAALRQITARPGSESRPE